MWGKRKVEPIDVGCDGFEAWNVQRASRRYSKDCTVTQYSTVLYLFLVQPCCSDCAQLKEGELAWRLEVSIKLASRLSSPEDPEECGAA